MTKIIKGITGAEFKAFWSDDALWGEDGYCEDLVFILEEEENLDMEAIYARYGDSFENLPDHAVLTLESGYQMPGKDGLGEDLMSVFRRWKKNRDFHSFSASINVSKSDDATLARVNQLMDELESLGGQAVRPTPPEPSHRPALPKR